MELFTDSSTEYADFAAYSVESPTFQRWATEVAHDAEVLSWLQQLPPLKRQPNLVFAAARWHGVAAPGPYDALRAALLSDDGAITRTIMSRSTQTNEVGRLATLLPALVTVYEGRPLALLEVGASAGLCLYPDVWGYRWNVADHTHELGSAPVLSCDVQGPMPVPSFVPPISWRGGLDLNPLDVRDSDAMAWLETLVWPEADHRRHRLRHGIEVARVRPPTLRVGDALHDLDALIEEASQHGDVVVFHSAVTAYLEPARRDQFVAAMLERVGQRRCHWIANEGKDVHPQLTSTGPEVPSEVRTFVLSVDGQAVAWTHGHGASMTWLEPHTSEPHTSEPEPVP